jgi:phage FluMu protein Com
MLLEFRCKKCNKLLCKESIARGQIVVKCPRCGAFNTLKIDSLKGKVEHVNNS